MRNLKLLKLIGFITLTILVVWGWSRIRFDVDILKLLPSHLQQVHGLSLFLEHFSNSNELIVTLEAENADQAAEAAQSLAKELESHPDLVANVIFSPPWENHPSALSGLLAYMLLNRPAPDIATLIDSLSPQNIGATLDQTLDTLAESISPQEVAIASYDPFGFSRLLLTNDFTAFSTDQSTSGFSSKDGKFRVLYITAAGSLHHYKEISAWITGIQNIVDQWKVDQHPSITIGITGEPAFVADISKTMEWDMMSSFFFTLFIIGLIYYITYRRFKPLFNLVLMLILTFVITLGLAGLFLRELTVIGVGFASIMIGLCVDYGYFIHHKSLEYSGSLHNLQLLSWNNIKWTAGTTAAAFFCLNLSSLPGLAQLGNLVGIGVLVGALVMIFGFAPINHRDQDKTTISPLIQHLLQSPKFLYSGAAISLLLVLGLGFVLIWKGFPKIDASMASLRPKYSEAQSAMEHFTHRLGNAQNNLSLIVTGTNEKAVFDRLQDATAKLQEAQKDKKIESFQTPLLLWPNSEQQQENLKQLQVLVDQEQRLQDQLTRAGFTKDAFALTKNLLDTWKSWKARHSPIFPEEKVTSWILRRTISEGRDGLLAMGMIQPTPDSESALTQSLSSDGIYLVSWDALGQELSQIIPREFLILITSLLGIITLLLWIGFRSIRDVLLLLCNLAFVFISLCGLMQILGIQWNLFNLAAILLLLGTGIDYGILLLLDLRQNGGRVGNSQKSLGLIIGLCSLSAIAGFGSISWANHQGLSSLGITCALGLSLDALISFFLFPILWKLSYGRSL